MAHTTIFKDFVFKDHLNRTFLWVAVITLVVQFAVLKYFYPFASYIHGDSFSYLDTAFYNKSINTYMIGYSMFLRALSVFTRSDTVLVALQYLLMQSAALGLLFTIFYFYRPSKVARIILLCFMIFNPLFLFIGNLVSSDAIFLALSLIWFTLLIWIVYKPNTQLIIWHAVVISIAFTFRYNALIYLFISIIAFILSGQKARKKPWGICLAALPIALFIIHTGNLYKDLTGHWQYSPFAGWQWANNAMYTYRYVDSTKRKPVPLRFQALDNMVRQYFDTTRDTIKHPEEKLMASTVYMWTPTLTLFKYRNNLFKKDSTVTELKKWASMGPLYKDYGQYIILKYPTYFLRYFIWPNAMKYYAPPLEFLEVYNSGKDSVTPIGKQWFDYKSLRLTRKTKTYETKLLGFYPILSGIINVLMFFGLIFFAMLEGFKQQNFLPKGILLGAIFWLLNAGFTITASSAALRFQSFPVLLAFIYSCILVDWICKMASNKPTEYPLKPR